MVAMELTLHIISMLALIFIIWILFLACMIYASAYNQDGFLKCIKLACKELWEAFWADP